MASLRHWLFAFVLSLGSVAHAAGDAVPVPALKARVTDLTGTLSAEQAASLEAELRAFEQKKGSQIAVLMLPSTQPETVEQYAIRVAEQWKIGRAKVDDGLILVIAKGDRKLRIEVGYGLEGVIPDAVAKRVISEVIAPKFGAGDFYGGVRDGTQALMRLIDGEKLPPPVQKSAQGAAGGDYQSLLVILFPVLVVVGGVLRAMLGRVFGAGATSLVAGLVVWFIMGVSTAAALAAIVAFVFALLIGSGVRGFIRGGLGGGGFGSGGGGGFSGGGGGFGGGGASGSW